MENCKLEGTCALSHTEKAGSAPKKRTNSVVVAKNIGSQNSLGRETFCTVWVSAILVEWALQEIGGKYGQEVPTASRHRTFRE